MAEIYFYHMTLSPLEAALPDLLVRAMGRGWKVLVQGGDAGRLEWLDDRLWQVPEDGFLPHGRAGGPRDGEQPVLLAQTADAANGAQVLMCIDGAAVDPETAARFERVCLVFDGNDESAVATARAQWKALTDAGLPARYWSQESGRWAEKASKNT